MSNRICYQVSKAEIEFHMIDMIYAALPMCAQTEKTIFSCKDNYAKLYIYMGVGARDLYIDEAYTVLDIFRFAEFFSNGAILSN